MKTKSLIFSLLCFFLFSFASHAQQPMGDGSPTQMFRSPIGQQLMKDGLKSAVRSFWDGQGANMMAMGMLNDPAMRTAWDVSDEQFQKIQEVQRTAPSRMMENPEFQKIMEEMQTFRSPDDPFMLNLDEEARQKLQDAQGRIMRLTMKTMSESMDNALTPELKQKMNESQLALMGEIPIVSPSTFEALHLTDDQKQKMEGIKKELEPDFEKHLENFADNQMFLTGKLFDELEKQGGFGNIGDPAVMQGVMRKLMEDPEYKKVYDEIQTSGKAFATQFKTKMFDVLTDEQWKRLQDLTDNPPEYIKALLKRFREMSGESEGSRGWQPTADSWKPGDAIPDAYRQERNTPGRFPRGE